MKIISDDVDFDAYLAEPEASQKVRPASAWLEDLIVKITAPIAETGVLMPWQKVGDNFRLRPNEITLWPGINGHGKSLVLGQIMLSAMAQGERVLIASMEMKPVSTVERMAKQAWGFERLTVDEARGFSQWTDDRLWIYDHLGSVHWEKLLGVFRYCCAELKMTHIVIDSLMRCGIADDDYKGQKQFMDALCTLKMDYPVHIHLVLHSRKLSDESQIPGKFDVKGSGTLTDLADNVVSVWRNKAKEAALQSPSHMRSAKDAAAIDGPDCLLCIDKQRHFEWEGKVALWYIPGCMQYVATDQEQSANLMMNSTATSVVDIEF